jgi:hypothetical protein
MLRDEERELFRLTRDGWRREEAEESAEAKFLPAGERSALLARELFPSRQR